MDPFSRNPAQRRRNEMNTLANGPTSDRGRGGPHLSRGRGGQGSNPNAYHQEGPYRGGGNPRANFSRGRGNSGRGFSRGGSSNGADFARARFAAETELVSVAKLQEMLAEDADEVVMRFHRAGNSFAHILRRKFKDEEALTLFVQIVGEKLCGAVEGESIRNALVSKVCTPDFLAQLKDLTFDLLVKGATPATAQLLTHLHSFYRFVGDKMPNMAADHLIPLVQAAAPIIASMNLTQGAVSDELAELSKKFGLLLGQLQEFKQKRDEEVKVTVGSSTFAQLAKRRDFERRWMEPPPEDFRSLPLIPTAHELLSGAKPFLRPSLTKGQYPSVQDYLDVHFRLLREDFVDPLREGIQEFYKTKEKSGHRKPVQGNVKIYRRVKLLPGLNFNTKTPSYTVQLETSQFLKKIKWERTKRLLNGSLLLFTQNDFGAIFLATVSRRDVKDLSGKGTFCITWESKPPEFQPNSYWDMLECDVFYETYRHTLHALREMTDNTFPMSKYIIEASAEKTPPPYLKSIDQPLDFKILMPEGNHKAIMMMDDCGRAHLLETDTWPSADELGMDNSQYAAFQAAMTREFSIIQGPPGTGKTFIGIQIAKFLLANKQHFLPLSEAEIKEITPKGQLEEDLESGLTAQGRMDFYMGRSNLRIETRNGGTTTEETKSKLNPLLHLNTPVLVVCYTNHALDQFLEAIHSVMLEMGMRPEDELVRVGGQSKSEAMKELMMFKRLENAVKTHSLPSDYREDYNSAFHKLRKVKRNRYVLLEILRSLNKPTGIVDLQSILDHAVSEQCVERILLEPLVSQTITALHKCDKLSDQFGLEHRMYGFPDFKPFKRVGTIFNFRATEESTKKPEQVIPEAANPPNSDSDSDEEEDYDLDELTANRIEELSYEVSEMDGRRVPIAYIIGEQTLNQELNVLSERIANNRRILEDKGATFQQYTAAQHAVAFCENKTVYNENIRLTLRQILERHADGRLQLPPVTDAMLRAVAARFESGTATEHEHWRENWSVYFHCVFKVREAFLREVVKLEEQLLQRNNEFKDVENRGYALILQKVKFVGATTTGAAKYNSILRRIKSKMVIVEEAAEVLESHIVTSITKHCQHLVLIGDHFQLRPKTTVYRLGKDFNLDISLFERMINNQMNAHVLEIQHRMRPDICDLLVPTIYTSLVNHDSVKEYPNVPGMSSNLFFIKHTEQEMGEADGMSKSNEHEAQFLTRLCRHLILQGIAREDITILTTYVGQMFLIKKLINKDQPSCVGVRVTAVDNYQGEENEVILLSLVRSNEENKIGFLNTDNRVCVAISRAKRGFYVIGNMDSMESNSSTWKRIREKLEAKENIGTALPLKCEVHGDITLVTSPDDFSNAPEGGCSRMCDAPLDKCAHKCILVCHVKDRPHAEYECRLPCDRKCVKNGHGCVGPCYQDPCPKCRVKVESLLGCGHSIELECHVDAGLYKCQVPMMRQLPCSHELELRCFEDPKTILCCVRLLKTLPCSHEQEANCYQDPKYIDCQTLVTVTLPDCKHNLTLLCHKAQLPSETWECVSACDTRLECGHACIKTCHFKKDPDHENYTCQKECSRSCPNNHKCMEGYEHKHKCHSMCPPCLVPVSARLPCSHETMMSCDDSRDQGLVESVSCKVLVMKKSVDCPHEIKIACSGIAEKKLCETMVDAKIPSACGHAVKVVCAVVDRITSEAAMAYCNAPCGQILKLDGIGCEHICTGTCSGCYNGRMHHKCREKCGRTLVCGHPCKSPCSEVCPPCGGECDMSCEHSRCRRPCGEPCTPCKEPCGWKCEHVRCTRLCGEKCDREACSEPCLRNLKCGHPCVGLCNETCPPLCAICDKEELTEIFLGNEDKEGARFVVLHEGTDENKCGRAFEVTDLDSWMGLEGDKKESSSILVKRCPSCTTTIRKSRRYGAIVKACMDDVIEVKTKIFGGMNETQNAVRQIGDRLEDIERRTQPEPELNFFGQFLYIYIFKNPRPKNRRAAFKKVDQYTLETLSHMLNWWEDACVDKKKLNQPLRQDLVMRYLRMLRIAKGRSLPLSKLELKQFNMEFRRLADIFQLYRRGSTEVVKEASMKPVYELVRNLVVNLRPYTSVEEEEFKLELKKLDGLLKETVQFGTEQQKQWRATFEAVSAIVTSWYRCRCGTLYAVGDCGQLNQAGQCPKCRAGIGGGSTNTRVADAHALPPVMPPHTPEVLDF